MFLLRPRRAMVTVFLLLLFTQPGRPAGADSCAGADCALTLRLVTGEQNILSLPGPVDKVAIGDPEVAAVSDVFPSAVMLLGKAVGRTNGFVWLNDEATPRRIDIRVTPPLDALEAELREDRRFADIRVTAAGRQMVLRGSVADLDDHAALRQLAAPYLGDYVDRVLVRQNLMISVEVKFAAVSTATLRTLGFDFTLLSDNFQGAVIGPGAVRNFNFASGLSLGRDLPVADAFSVFFSLPGANFNSILGMLDSVRAATTLANPTLVVRSGEEAEFIAGGKIPIPVPRGDNGVGIQFEEYGIRLKLRPTILSADRIVLEIAPEISEINAGDGVSIGGTTIPALSRRAAATTLELAGGQSFVLAGLLSESAANTEDQLPVLGSLPVLGAFFKRVRNAKQRQELVIIATPHIVTPLSREAVDGPLPGAELRAADPSIGDMLLGRTGRESTASVQTAADVPHGLLP